MALQSFTFSTRLECLYLVDEPEAFDGSSAVFALHGYGSTPDVMATLARALVGLEPLVVALRAPYAFYQGTPSSNQVGYSWATHTTSEASVRLHHDMVLEVFNAVERRWSIAAGRRILAGFSQPVGLNYRFAATHPQTVRGVIGACGGVPKDWETGPLYKDVTASLLHIARQQDEFYPAEVSGRFEGRLRTRARDVEFHMLEGGHRFPSKGSSIVRPWMSRILSSGLTL
ncbi:MAG: alpha/beta hydrolase [Bryobacteraceae bacterium]